MTARLGMDPDEVRRLGTALEDGADTLAAIRTQVTRRLDQAVWHGPDAHRMRGLWAKSAAPALAEAVAALRRAARVAGENAHDQERASGSTGSSAFTGAATGSRPGPSAFLGAGTGSSPGASAFAGATTGSSPGASALVGAGTGSGSESGGGVTGWLADRGAGVVDWFGDRANDVGGFVDATQYVVSKDGRDTIHSILAQGNGNPILDDWMNVADSALQFGDSFLTGEAPRTTEVVGSLIRWGGAAAGLLLTTGTLGALEANFFDDGHPVVSAPQSVPQDEITAPKDLAAVMDLMDDAYIASDGSIRVLTIDGTEPHKAVVAIPGTQTWNPLASSNPADATADLVEVGGGRATWTQGVELALREAGLEPGTEVMLLGALPGRVHRGRPRLRTRIRHRIQRHQRGHLRITHRHRRNRPRHRRAPDRTRLRRRPETRPGRRSTGPHSARTTATDLSQGCTPQPIRYPPIQGKPLRRGVQGIRPDFQQSRAARV